MSSSAFDGVPTAGRTARWQTRTTARRLRVVAVGIGFSILILGVAAAGLGDYEQNVLTRAFLFAIPALTVGVLWGFTGVLTFSQGAFFGIGAYAAGLTFTHIGYDPWLAVVAVIAGCLVAASIAAFVSWLAFWHGATSLYVAVVTLVVPIVIVQLIYSGGTFTGSSSGLVGFSVPEFSKSTWFLIAGTFLIVVTAAVAVFLKSDYGTLLRAIRDNEERSLYLGIRTDRVKGRLMIAMAALSAVAGFMYACVSVIAAAQHAGFVFGTELVINVALGGRSTILGPVVGTVGLEWASAYLSGFLPFIWKLLIGALFVLVIVILPEGVLGAIWKILKKSSPKMSDLDSGPQPSITRAADDDGAFRNRPKTALQLDGVAKNYGALPVLTAIDLTVAPGELVGIVGPNGAGKTTLMRCISDGLQRSAGDVRINGQNIGRASPAQLVSLGLGRSFQNTNLYETLSVTECMRLARYRHSRPSCLDRSQEIVLPSASYQVLTSTNLFAHARERVADLSHGMKRALELAMVLALEPSVLLLDEPTAGLTKEDRGLIGKILRDLQEKHKIAILLIEHDFDFVKDVCSRLVVLNRGKLVLDGTVEEVVRSEVVQNIYSGHAQ